MSEDAQKQEQLQPKLHIVSQYTKDLSFENIFVQKGEAETDAPEISVQVNIVPRAQENGPVEVSLKLSATAETKKQKYYIIELDYAGRFEIANVPEDQMHPFVMIECPRLLFPFARQIISETVKNGGYAALNLDPIDFVSLYRNELIRRAQAQPQNGQSAQS